VTSGSKGTRQPPEDVCHAPCFLILSPLHVGGGQEEPKMALVAPLESKIGHSYPLPPFISMSGFIPSC